MLHDPGERRLFPKFTPEQVARLERYGDPVEFRGGDTLFEQGKHPYNFFVVTEGRVRITKVVQGTEMVLTVHEPGEFAGELSILSGAPPIATGRAIGAVKAICIPSARVRELIATKPEFAGLVLPAMAGRVQEVDSALQQQEKLAALGRMSAGLAHELNNPAAAARRAARQLEDAVAQAQSASIRMHDHPFPPAQQAVLDRLHEEARACCRIPLHISPIVRSEKEDEVADWLEAREVEEPWEIAPVLVTAGLEPPRLDELEEALGREKVPCTIHWLASSLTVFTLLREVDESTQRISALVGSIKEYSHRDQAPALGETDLRAGLESTLALLNHKLKQGITVVREFDDDLPRVCAYAGELNQVWTNLIDNAVDAMGGRGTLTVRAGRVDEDDVAVEIADDGPGIANEVLERIWEPFFTTKGVGEGSGLGLDIARRIVTRRHGGSIRVASAPGETVFRIVLRIAGPPKSAALEAEAA